MDSNQGPPGKADQSQAAGIPEFLNPSWRSPPLAGAKQPWAYVAIAGTVGPTEPVGFYRN